MLNKHPELPQGEGAGSAKRFSLEEILTLRNHFAEEGVSTKEYRPYRPKGLPAKVVWVRFNIGKSMVSYLETRLVEVTSMGAVVFVVNTVVEDESIGVVTSRYNLALLIDVVLFLSSSL